MGFTKDQQKAMSIAIYIFVTANVMYMITGNVRAYIGLDYPDVKETLVTSLITLPNLMNLIVGVIIGPIAARYNKIVLLIIARACFLIFTMLMFINGVMHGPFWIYIVACMFCGVNLGSFGPLVNSIVGEIFEEKNRANKISAYNVWVNIGGVILLQATGIIAAHNDGAGWSYAYLMGLWTIVATVGFLVVLRKTGYKDDKATRAKRLELQNKVIEEEMAHGDSTVFTSMGKVWSFVIVTSLVHCVFYIGINAYYLTVSNYIITEHELGTSAQAGTANSLVRAALVVIQLTYPLWFRLLKDWTLPVGYAITGIGLIFALKFDSSLFGIYACAACAGISTALVHAAFYSKGLNYVPRKYVSVAAALNWGIANSGAFIATYVYTAVCGPMLETENGIASWLKTGMFIMAAVVAVSAVLYIFMFPEVKNRNKRLQREAEEKTEG